MFKLNMLFVFLIVASCDTLAQQPTPPAQPSQTTQPSPKGIPVVGNRDIPDGLAPGPYSLIILMNNQRVLKELRLTEEQQTKLEAAKKKQLELRSQYMKETELKRKKATEDNNTEELAQLSRSRREAFIELAAQTDDALLKRVLDRRQGIRLQQIRLQAEGPKAFERQEIQENLALTPEQIQEVKKISFEAVKQYFSTPPLSPDIQPPTPGNKNSPTSKAYAQAFGKAQSSLANERIATMRKIEKVLINAQRAKYRNMIGEPFDFIGTKDEKQLDEEDRKKAEERDKGKKNP